MTRMQLDILTTSRGRGVEALKRQLTSLKQSARNMRMQMRIGVRDNELTQAEQTLQRLHRQSNISGRFNMRDYDLEDAEHTLRDLQQNPNINGRTLYNDQELRDVLDLVNRLRSRATINGTVQVDDSELRTIRRLLNQIQNNSNVHMQFSQSGLDDISDQVAGLVASVAGVAAGAGLAGVGTQYQEMSTRYQSELGATGKDNESLVASTRDLYKTGKFGADAEGFDSIQDSIIALKQQFNDLSGADLETAAIAMHKLGKIMDEEPRELNKNLSVMAKQFNISILDALDLTYKGVQQGLNRDMDTDVLGEFSTNFARNGKSAGDFINTLVGASKNGIFQIEKVPDALNEMQANLSQLTDSAQDDLRNDLATIGLSYTEIENGFLSGGEAANQAISKVLNAMHGLQDKSMQYKIGQQIFGSFYEDMGVGNLLTGLGATENYIAQSGQNIDDLIKNSESNFKETWDSFKATLVDSVLPIANAMLEILTPLLNAALPILETFGAILERTNPVVLQVATAIGMVAGAVGPLVLAISGFLKVFKFVQPLLVGATALIGGPVGLAIAIGVLATTLLAFSVDWGAVWSKVQSVTQVTVDAVKGFFVSLGDTVSGIWGNIKSFFSGVGDFFADIKSNITDTINNAIAKVNELFSFQLPSWLGGGQFGLDIPQLSGGSNTGANGNNTYNATLQVPDKTFGGFVSSTISNIFS